MHFFLKTAVLAILDHHTSFTFKSLKLDLWSKRGLQLLVSIQQQRMTGASHVLEGTTQDACGKALQWLWALHIQKHLAEPGRTMMRKRFGEDEEHLDL